MRNFIITVLISTITILSVHGLTYARSNFEGILLFDRDNNIYTMDSKSNKARQLTNTVNGRSMWGRWSPDKKTIVYHEQFSSSLKLITEEGSILNEISIKKKDCCPFWESAGNYLYVESGLKNKLKIIDVNTSKVYINEQRTLDEKLVKALDFSRVIESPDGNYFVEQHGLSIKMSVQGTGSSFSKNIGSDELILQYPSWSNDSSKVAYVTQHKEKTSINIFSVEDSRNVKFQLDENSNHLICCGLMPWSPDNKEIAFTSYDDFHSKGRIFILNLETGKERFVTTGNVTDWRAAEEDDNNCFTDGEYKGSTTKYDISLITGKVHSRLLRNEIFARHGRTFKSEGLNEIFESCDWYKPNPNYTDDMLNDTEKKNVKFILDYEKKMGWR